MRKCEHGVAIPAGETTAIYCSGCNPHAMPDRPLKLAMSRPKPPSSVYREAQVLDAVEYMEQPAGVRLMEAKCDAF